MLAVAVMFSMIGMWLLNFCIGAWIEGRRYGKRLLMAAAALGISAGVAMLAARGIVAQL
jgi:hypothetical protein